MVKQKILLVEDQEKYRQVALLALKGKDINVARNYDEAVASLDSSDAVISDIFFAQNATGNSPELQARVIDAVKQGLVKKYVEQLSARLKKETGILVDDRLRKSFQTIGYHHLGCSQEYNRSNHLDEAIMMYAKSFKEKTAEKLEEAVNDMIGIGAGRIVEGLFIGLKDYMKQAPENQPFGYLVAEEAEKAGKPFVLVTSLRHAESSLIPILRAAKAQDWNILEGANGSKEDVKYWMQAYELIRAGKK